MEECGGFTEEINDFTDDFTEEVKKDELPRFVLVEVSQLEKLLQRCPLCGALPGGPRTGLSRNIEWTKKG